MNSHPHEGYLRVFAGFCLLLCGSCSVYFLGTDLDAWQASGPIPPPLAMQVLCILGTVLATAYFVVPKTGRH